MEHLLKDLEKQAKAAMDMASKQGQNEKFLVYNDGNFKIGFRASDVSSFRGNDKRTSVILKGEVDYHNLPISVDEFIKQING